MKKNLTALLQKGNLTPKERFLLLMQNGITGFKTGKEPLSEADKKALENWQAKNNEEVREWNKYNEGNKLAGQMEVQAKLTYLEAKAVRFRKSYIDFYLTFYPIYREIGRLLEGLEKIKRVDIKEAIAITKKQREQKLKQGWDFEYSVFELAMELLGDKDKAKLEEATDEDAIFDEQRLDHETKIANLLAGKTELTKEAKEKLAELVGKHSTNNYTKESQLYFNYASIPLYEIAERFLKDKGVKFLDLSKDRVIGRAGRVAIDMTGRDILDKAEKLKEILENYARDNKITIEAIIKEACLKWLDEDLLKKHPPLVLREKELFNKWIKTKAEAKATLQKLIDKGELKTQDETGQGKTITGESLYNFKGDYKFIKDFKKRVDEYEANLGLVYANDDPEHKGDPLDQELLICDKGKTGEPDIFSSFGLTLGILKRNFKATQIIKETKKKSDIFLEFRDEDIREAFKEMRESLIYGYAMMLAYRDIFKKLSKTYEIDLTIILNNLVENVSEFIDYHNRALSIATGQKPLDEEGRIKGWSIKEVLKTEDDLFIDKGKILPDINESEKWIRKFEDILGDDF